MKISLNWLKDFIEIDAFTPENLAERLTFIGLEVEAIEKYESIKGGLSGVVVGSVLSAEPHPNADRLRVCSVDVGQATPLQIVCGAPNVAAGQKVPVALIGTTLYPATGEPIVLKRSKIRSVESEGMICAEDELGLGENHDGILTLDTEKPVGTPCAEILGVYVDTVFHIGLTPNRTDAICHFGVARDLAAALSLPLKNPVAPDFEAQGDCPVKITLADAERCPRYSGVAVRGLRLASSPVWMQHRLNAVGQRPINAVVDVTNYVMFEIGRPLHGFDLSKIAGGEIIVRTASPNEKFITLDEKELILTESDLVIADAEKALVLAGVKGGLNSGVTEETTDIFIESAYFQPQTIRKSARRFGLHTETSYRFERGTDPSDTLFALKRAVDLICAFCVGIPSSINDAYPKVIEPKKIIFSFAKANLIFGFEMPKDKVKEILTRLEYKIESETDGLLTLSVPLNRVDVTRPRDVEEDVLRVYGLNRVPIAPKINASLDLSRGDVTRALGRRLAVALAAAGYQEIRTNSIIPEKWLGQNAVRLLNPLSEEHTAMRTSLLPSALEVLAHNLNRKMSDVSIFEFGKIYVQIDGKETEKDILLVLLAGNETPPGPHHKSRAVDLFSIKRTAELIAGWLNLPELSSKEIESDAEFAFGYTLSYQKREIMRFGAIGAELCKQFDLKQSPYILCVDWAETVACAQKQATFTPLPKFPAVRRDISMTIEKEVRFADIEAAIRQANPKLIREVTLFDVFYLKEAEQTSYAVAVTLRHDEKTLTDAEIDKTMIRARSGLEKINGIKLRVG